MKKYRQLIKELPSKKVVFAFGRFQPPTTGHELLVKAVQKIASAQGADHVIYASKTEDKKQNPLPVSRKVYYLQRMFPGANFKAANEQERTFIEAAKALNKRYKNIVMVAGSDRIAEYKKILEKYNGTEFKFDTVSVVSAGERDPDSDNASGMSGTKMREAAKAGKFNEFKKGIPHSLTVLDARRLMNEIRKAYDLEPVKESLNIAVDDLREKYFRGEIFNVGDIVVSENKQCVVVKRGSNHLLLSEEGTDVKFTRWIKDVSLPAEQVQEELTNKTLKSNSTDQIKAARIIATTLGVENVESSANPAQIVNLGLRKIKSKALNAESYEILKRMLKMATDVGIKFDTNLMPQKLKEAYYDKLLSYDTEGRMTEIDTNNDGIPDWLERNMTKIGSGLHNDENDQLRKQKINYHLGEADTGNLTRQVAKSALAAKHAKEKEALSTKHASEKESLKEYEISHDGKGNYRDDEGNEFRGSPRGSFARRHTITSTPPSSEPHSVHINGKKWKTYGSQSHAQNVANKIKGATVHKEEVKIDEISQKLAGDYYGAATKKHLDTVGMKPNMYGRIEKDMGKQRKAGVDRALDRVTGVRKTNEDYEYIIQSIDEALASTDKGEYDYEGAMARTQLQTVCRNAQELIDMLGMDDNLPEWVQSKITLAQDYISSVTDYLKSRDELGEAVNPSQQAAIAIAMKKAGKKPKYKGMNELSTDLLARYKKKASEQASAADKAGDYAKGNKRFSGIIKATKKQFDNDLKEEHIVHVDDGSNYGDEPHPKDVEHVNAGVKKHGGEFDGHSDKGAFFKFKSQSDAKNFADHVKKSPHKSVHADLHEEVEICETADAGLAAKAAKSGISIGTLRKVYRRGVAAWNSGHRPGTTPQQWGMARVNSYIGKGKGTYGGADKDLHEEEHLEEAVPKDTESGLPKKYVAGLSKSTAKARAAHFDRADKLSDSDPRAYEPAPGDATAKTKLSKHTLKYRAMFGEEMDEEIYEACWDSHKQVGLKKKGNRMVPNCVPKNEEVVFEAIDKEHPIAKEYESLKKQDIKTLRGMISQQHKIVDTSEFRTKDHAASHILRNRHGDKKVAAVFGLSEEQFEEGYLQSADQKIGKDGKKHAARLIKIGSDAPTNTRNKGFDAFSMEEVEISEEDIDVIVDEFQTWEDVIDAYEDDELAIIDEETGEEIDDVVSEGTLNEVLSRIERIRAKTRFARTKSKRMIRTKMALKRSSPQSVINTRARKLAIQTIKLRLAKKPLNTLSVAEKERLEQRIAKMKPILNRIAMKLAPRVRQIEKQRLSHSTYTK